MLDAERDAAVARAKPPARRHTGPLRADLQPFVRDFRATCHVKLMLANAVGRLVPDLLLAAGGVRPRLYRWAGFRIGEDVGIFGNLTFTSAMAGMYEKLVIGPGTFIGDRVTINLDGPVTIGAGVGISPRVAIYTASHRIGRGSRRMADGTAAPVTIEDGAWIRLGALIMPGVTVGRGSVVAAGAVVLADVPPNTYVEGNPARVVRRLPWAE